MHCYACDVILTDFESRRKFPSGEYTDLCSKCLSTIMKGVEVPKQEDHLYEDVIQDDFDSRFQDR